jgi:hypothetical protein
MKNNKLDMAAVILVAVGLFGIAIMLVVALRSWPQPVPNDAGNQWGEAHYRAMQIEAQAMKEEGPK